MNNFKTLWLGSTAILSLSMVSNMANAQESVKNPEVVESEDSGLDVVIVTATRRSQNLQDVPVTISAFTAESLESKGVVTVTDLSGLSPNFRVNSPFSETQPNFTVRGIGVANEFNPNAQSPVGVYFDEVYQGFRANHGSALFDLERVEVLKGPQGTLYGRNTTGGAVNVISTRPDLEGSEGYVKVGFGNYGRFSMSGAAETTLVEDKLGARIALTRLSRDGYIENVSARYGGQNPFVGDEDYDSADSWAGRLSVRATPSENLDLNFKGYFSSQEPIGTAGTVVQLNPTGADIAGTVLTGLGERESAATNQGRYETDTWGLNFKADWLINDIEVTSVTGYDHGELSQPFDFDGSPSLVGQWDTNTADFESFSQDLHAAYSFSNIKVIGGVYFGWQEVSVLNRYLYLGFFNQFSGPGQFNPAGQFAPPPNPPTAIDALQQLTQTQSTYAAFLEVEANLTDRLTLTVGGRLTKENIDLTDFSSLLHDSDRNPFLYAYSSAGANSVAPSAPILTGIVPDIENSITEPTGRIMLSYDVSDDSMLYSSYSRGYRSGSFNGQSLIPVPNFVPAEFVDAYEVGLKSRLFDNTLQLNGAVFYNDYQGQQVQEIQNGASFLRSLDGRLYGFELDAVFQPSDRFTLSGTLGYLNSEYDDGQFLAPGDPSATDPRGIALGGNSFPFSPEWTASISPKIVIAKMDKGDLTLNANAVYTSKQFFDPFNDRQAIGPINQGEDAYTLVDANLRYDTGKYAISLWVKNAFDTDYNAYALNIESFGFDFFTPGAPQTYGVEASVKF